MKKKIIALMMCIVMVVGVLPVYAFAEDYSDWTYSAYRDGTAVITGYNGTDSELVFPKRINGYTMVGIADNAFDYDEYNYFEKPTVTKITIPETYKRIGENFMDYTFELEEINLPHSLEYIGYNSFRHSRYVRLQLHEAAMNNQPYVAYIGEYCVHAEQNRLFPESYTIKPGTRLIASGAFYSVTSLKKLIIPEGVEYINDGAFVCCSVSSVVIPSTVKSINWLAFAYTKLTSIVIPKSVEYIDEEAFDWRIPYLTIYGVADTFAETFANEHSIPFIELKDVLYGDVDEDGTVSITDYSATKSHVSGETEFEGCAEIIGDMNSDRVIDAFDLFEIDRTINA